MDSVPYKSVTSFSFVDQLTDPDKPKSLVSIKSTPRSISIPLLVISP